VIGESHFNLENYTFWTMLCILFGDSKMAHHITFTRLVTEFKRAFSGTLVGREDRQPRSFVELS
jgi:hypothetical protein